MPYRPAFWHLKNCMKVEKDTPCTSVLLAVERDTPCTSKSLPYKIYIYTLTSIPVSGEKEYTLMFILTIHPHVYIVDSGNEYTLTFTPMLVVKRDSLSQPHC